MLGLERESELRTARDLGLVGRYCHCEESILRFDDTGMMLVSTGIE